MKKICYITLLLLLCQVAFAQIITVKQDSTGDYTTIQAAVTAAVDGDTVLVWPGIYYESIYIEEKGITVGSLTLTTGDEAYIRQTIVDGNHEGGCFATFECEERVEINGFTLQNGNATWYGTGINGGGIWVKQSDTDIQNCVIQNNTAYGGGGGVHYSSSEGMLSSTVIRNNHAHFAGGGLLSANSDITFDTIRKCNIYLNTASQGTDVYNSQDGEHPLYVVIDTCTVINPDYYYLHEFTNPGGALLNHEISAGKITQTYQDLYVASDGDNNNSGLTPEESLQTISFALLKMASDSLSPDTIHLANGIYSPSTGEKFPLSLKKDASIRGESRDSTILDAEDMIYLMQGIYYADHYSISRLTLQNGNGEDNSYFHVGAFILRDNRNCVFEDLLVTGNRGYQTSGGFIYNGNNTIFRNIDFISNIGGKALRTQHSNPISFYDTTYVEHCRFLENEPDYSIEYGFGGGAAVTSAQATITQLMTTIFMNCLFAQNHTKDFIWAGTNSLSVSQDAEAYLINSTLVDNTSDNPEGGNIGVTYSSNLHIYNSIMYNNQPAELYMSNPENGSDCNLYIQNSLLDGGEAGIRILDEGNNVFYDEATNLDTDPFFLNKWEHPYQINNGSPCIDAGTLNLPDFIELPDTDLAGNPRIVGDSIDMGAYEWNPTVGVSEYQPIEKAAPKLMSAAPNPFSHHTTISAKWDFTGHVQIEVYNNSGLRVKTLKSGNSGRGSISAKWNGKDASGNLLPSGIYHVVMFWDGKEIESLKVVKN